MIVFLDQMCDPRSLFDLLRGVEMGGVKAHLPFGTHTAIVSELNMILHK